MISTYNQSQNNAPRTLGLSATNISSYYHFQCDLSLYNSYYGKSFRNLGAEQSELVKAQLERGVKWESKVLSWLDEKDLLARVASGILDATDIQAVIDVDEREHFYITGLHFHPPLDAFKEEYSRNGTQMPQFSIAKPDLLEVKRSQDGLIQWQIIDIKSSLSFKTSHHAQISFYHLCMANILSTQHFAPMGIVSVWLPSQAGIFEPSFENIKSYPTRLLIPIFKKFLFYRLPTILAQNDHEVKWHYNPLCRGCSFESSCRERVVEDRGLGTMSNISIQDAEILKSILDLQRSAVSNRSTDIEDLDLILHSKSNLTNLRDTHPSTIRKAQKILALPIKASHKIYRSPVIAAALLGQIQVTQRRSYTFPKSEDIAVIISLVNDPSTLSPAAFCITTHFTERLSLPTIEFGKIEHFVMRLSMVVQTILNIQYKYHPPLRTQFYVFSQHEGEALQRHLIDLALTSDISDTSLKKCIKLCIGAICEGAALLSTAFQPLVLSAALLDFLWKSGERTSFELRTCSERLGLPKSGTDDEMLRRIRVKINDLKTDGNRYTDSTDGVYRAEIGLLPRVVVVKRELQRNLALPVPGYWDLQECFSVLCPQMAKTNKCPTDEQVFADLLAGNEENLKRRLHRRNSCVYKVIIKSRSLISSVQRVDDLLVNEARVLASNFMDVCKEDHLRKLFYMQQFEVLAKLTVMWQHRIEGCPDSPMLEYQKSSRSSDPDSCLHTFRVESGAFESNADKEVSLYQFILTEEPTSIYGDHDSVPVEAFFDDLAVFNTHFPLNKYTRSKWLSQPKIVQRNLLVANLADIIVQGKETIVILQTYGNLIRDFQKGRIYRLSPRLVDFNSTKVLSTLLELDLQVSSRSNENYASLPPFLQLCIDPHEFSRTCTAPALMSEAYIKSEINIDKLFRELDVEHAESLILKSSQRKVIHRILSYRLSVILGPPGTGKTHTTSLSILRLLEVYSRHNVARQQIFLLSALTRASIHACLEKLHFFRSCYQNIAFLSKEWLQHMIIQHVANGYAHPGPEPNSDNTYVYVGTVFQLYSFCKRFRFQSDCVFIDEAGQVGLGLASLVLRSLKEDGRVIIAGDNEQLAPILSAEYPVLETCLFGSILDCLMRPIPRKTPGRRAGSSSSPFDEVGSRVVQLTDNFRLNEDLGEFVSTIYMEKFKMQKTQTKTIATSLKSLESLRCRGRLETDACTFLVALSKAMLGLPQITLRPPKHENPGVIQRDPGHRPISLSLLRTNFVTVKSNYLLSYEDHVACEASLAASIVKLIRRLFPSESIFVATPHRFQRHAVREALGLELQSSDLVDAFRRLRLSPSSAQGITDDPLTRVDTIERLQGSEAAFVICLFSHPSMSDRAGSVHFLLQRRRLNVAISRARTLCIMITSDTLLNPDPSIFMNDDSLKGYIFLKDFEDRAWTGNFDMRLEDVLK